MKDELKIEAGVSIECRNCNLRTTVPALNVVPGVKCSHCGAELVLNDGDLAAKAVMLKAAADRKDVKVD